MAYFGTDIPNVYLDEDVIRRHNLGRRDVEQTAIGALMSTGLVEHVYTQADLLSASNPADPYLKLFQNSFFQARSPHLGVLVTKYAYVSSYVGFSLQTTAYDSA